MALHCLFLFRDTKRLVSADINKMSTEFLWIQKIFSDEVATPPTMPATPFIDNDINSS